MDEGYVKYRCQWSQADITAIDGVTEAIAQLTVYRDALKKLNFIGQYADGTGFGNISRRLWPPRTGQSGQPQFVISGTDTAHLSTLTPADYALVSDFDWAQNQVVCEGMQPASSETMTHGVLYASNPAIGAVIHIHHPRLWTKLLQQVPTTRSGVPYGTPEMAEETLRLLEESPLPQQQIFAMAGHRDGVVTFGDSLQTAYRVLINWNVMVSMMSLPESAAALQLPHQQA